MKIIAGVDCHKGTYTIAFIDAVGKVVHDLEIPANAAGYADAIAAARLLGEVVWGLEGTGVYGRCFAKALLAADMIVFEVPGIVTKRHRKHASQHGKSDRKDAQAIAEAVLRDSERYRGSASLRSRRRCACDTINAIDSFENARCSSIAYVAMLCVSASMLPKTCRRARRYESFEQPWTRS